MAGRLALAKPARSLWHPTTLLATWFGAGLLPLMPGTWGSLAALPFAWVFLRIAGESDGTAVLLVAAVICFFVGWAATHFYMRHTDRKDPTEVVIDEVAGQWLVLIVANPHVWWHWLAGFLLFRLCDIVKPFPANVIDRRPSALAVMADDTVAAGYALFILAILIFARRFIHGS
jgi:phosphatidylglycerophosphatase A